MTDGPTGVATPQYPITADIRWCSSLRQAVFTNSTSPPRPLPPAFGRSCGHGRIPAISETNIDWQQSGLIRKRHATGCRTQLDRLFDYRPYSLNPQYAYPIVTFGPVQTMPTQNAAGMAEGVPVCLIYLSTQNTPNANGPLLVFYLGTRFILTED
jgi:hypothetical protein